MRKKRLFAVLLLASAAATLAAQTTPSPSRSPVARPDFSGTWVAADGARGAFLLGAEFTVTQDAKGMTVEGRTPLTGATKATYLFDGTVSKNGTVDSRVTWDGSKLVITMTGSAERTQVWSLDVATARLEIETRLNRDNAPMPGKVLYHRK